VRIVARAFVGFIVAGGLGWICIGNWPAAAALAALGAFYAMGDPTAPPKLPR